MFHWQLKLLKYEFQKPGYSSCFFILTDILKGKIDIIERKPLQLSVSFSGTVSLQTRIKLQKLAMR